MNYINPTFERRNLGGLQTLNFRTKVRRSSPCHFASHRTFNIRYESDGLSSSAVREQPLGAIRLWQRTAPTVQLPSNIQSRTALLLVTIKHCNKQPNTSSTAASIGYQVHTNHWSTMRSWQNLRNCSSNQKKTLLQHSPFIPPDIFKASALKCWRWN